MAATRKPAATRTAASAAAKAEAITPFSKGQVAAMRTVDEHRALPDLVFDGPDGKKKTIADFAGKTLLVNLWATWCVPCREEMPALNALQKELGGEDFQVVTIASGRNPQPAIDKFFTEAEIDALPVLLDPRQKLAREFGISRETLYQYMRET